MKRMRFRLGVAFNHSVTKLMRVVTRILRFLGVRDTVRDWRNQRRRKRRVAVELRGDDRLSKPALHRLDGKLDAIIDRERGFFIEAGGHDGFTQSNTYWLERFRGWRGLLVEPMPQLAAEARLSRPDATVKQCALVSAEHQGEAIRMHFGDLMSMVDGTRDTRWTELGTVRGWVEPFELDVEARTLSSLLDEIDAPDVDLLSLDVEGYEAQVLRGLDFDRHAPRYVLVEMHDPANERPVVDEALGEGYLVYGWLSPLDLLYVRRDVARPDIA